MNRLYRYNLLRSCLVMICLAYWISPGLQPASAQMKEELCDCSPELTLLLRVNDVRRTADLVTKAGGKILYDPNLGIGNDIPFLVVNLPPTKLNDKKFIDSLKLPPLIPLALIQPALQNCR